MARDDWLKLNYFDDDNDDDDDINSLTKDSNSFCSLKLQPLQAV